VTLKEVYDEVSDALIVVCEPCAVCGDQAHIVLSAEEQKGYLRWKQGEYIQRALPDWPKEKRELLISGVHRHCWEVLTAEMEDEE
jgi:hypothetical protein